MSDVTNPLQSISYTNKDFSTIYPELLDLVKELTFQWDPSISNESDPGVVLLKLNALIADKCNFNCDTNVLECFPLSVSQEENARQLFEQLGYYMHWYKSAIQEISLRWVGEYASDVSYTIPKFTMVSDSNISTVFTLIGGTSLSTSSKLIPQDLSMKCTGELIKFIAIQGVRTNYEVNGEFLITYNNLDSNNRLYFPTTDIAENGIFITNAEANNYSEWEKVDNLLVESLSRYDKYYKFGVSQDSSLCYLEFPENAEELFGEGINITYIRTTGEGGNVRMNTIDNFYDPVVPIEDSSILLTKDNTRINNYSSVRPGENKETINEAYKGYKSTVGTFNTLITLRDYMNYIINQDGLVSNCFVCDRTNDIQDTYQIISSVNLVDKFITKVEQTLVTFDGTYIDESGVSHAVKYSKPEDTLSAFSIKLYLLRYIANVISPESFNATFDLLSNVAQVNAKSAMEDSKCISHDYVNIETTNGKSSHFCMFKNVYPLSIKINTQYQLTKEESEELIKNVQLAIYENFNSSNLTFGEEISLEELQNVVLKSDSRIKSMLMDNIDYTTYAVYLTDDGYKEVIVSLNDEELKNIQNEEEAITVIREPISGKPNFKVSVDVMTFISKVGLDNYNEFTFTYSAANKNWSYAGEVIDLSDFGIEVTPEKEGEEINAASMTVSQSKMAQFRDEIYTKSILAGTTPVFDKDERFDYNLNQDICKFSLYDESKAEEYEVGDIARNITYIDETGEEIHIEGNGYLQSKEKVDDDNSKVHWESLTTPVENVERISTDLFVEISSDEMTPSVGKYTLRENEGIQLLAPNLIETLNFSQNAKIEYYIKDGLSAGRNYQLRRFDDGKYEYIIIYWLSETDGNYHYNRFIGGGDSSDSAIICLSGFSLAPCGDDKPVEILSAGERSTLAYSGTLYYSYSNKVKSVPLSDTQRVLTGSRNISIKKINEITLNASYACYWILNNADPNGYYYLFDEIPNYTAHIHYDVDELLTHDDTIYRIKEEISSTDNINWDSISAKTELGSQSYTLGVGEYFIYTTSEYTNLVILGAGTTITRSGYCTDYLGQNIWRTNTMNIVDILNTGTSAISDNWFRIPVDTFVDVVENQYITLGSGCQLILTESKYKPELIHYFDISFNSKGLVEGTLLRVDEDGEEQPPEKCTLSDFAISYVDLSDSTIDIENMNLSNSEWTARTLLSCNMSSSIEYVLKDRQSMQLELTNGDKINIVGKDIKNDTDDVINYETNVAYNKGDIIYVSRYDKYFEAIDNITAEENTSWDAVSDIFEEISIQQSDYYPVTMLSSLEVALDGTQSIYTYKEKDSYDREYLSLYLHKKILNSSNVIFNTDGKTNVIFPAVKDETESSSVTLYFNLPEGNYVLPYSNSYNGIRDVDIRLNNEPIFPISYRIDDDVHYNYNAVKTNFIKLVIDKPSELSIKVTGNKEQIALIFGNPVRYNAPSNITEEYFNKLLYLISVWDIDNEFNYTYQINDDDVIKNPLLAKNFLLSNHVFNKYTICKLNTGKSSSYTVLGKK